MDTTTQNTDIRGTARPEWKSIRDRLRNPPNAVPDCGIDLKRKPEPARQFSEPTVVPERPNISWVSDLIKSSNQHLREIGGPPAAAPAAEPIYTPPVVLVRTIIATVAKFYRVSSIDIMSSRRTANVVRPRQVAMYLARTLTVRSLPDIGRRFGGKDHTTCLYAVRKIEALRQSDEKVNADIEALIALLQPSDITA